MIRANPLAALGLVLVAVGCNSFDEPSEVGPNDPVLVVPTDERPAIQAEKPPPPISGGTLAVSDDGALAVAADPDRDRVALVDLNSATLKSIITLEEGDEPGRVVLDHSGHAYAALRGGGAIAVINLEASELAGRLELCSEPRGLALANDEASLHVACAGGELISVPTSGGAPTRTLDLGPDLRDVVVVGADLMVSRFRSAEILRVDASGSARSIALPTVGKPVVREFESGGQIHAEEVVQDLTPSVAWRMVSNGADGVLILHQRGVEGELSLSTRTAEVSPYGGGPGGCGAIVQPAVTEIAADDSKRTTKPIASLPLGVDLAVAPTTGRLAVANAGAADPNQPESRTIFLGDGAISTGFAGEIEGPLRVMSTDALRPEGEEMSTFGGCAQGETSAGVEQPVTAVAWSPDGALVAQTREPAQLMVIQQAPAGARTVIELGGESVFDTGHEIFHRDSSGGLACASCHPEGREDGRVWQFEGVGMRRTQPLDVGLAGTQPFHWSGDLPGLSHLMDEVFVSRMGGVLQSSDRLASLERWLFARQPLAPLKAADDPAVQRGRLLFRSPEVGCTTCHQGEKLTHPSSFQVRASSEAFQVPSLLGVGYRAPFMHDGCAATLEARFDPACGGGELHGNTKDLSDSERADLVSYLQSL